SAVPARQRRARRGVDRHDTRVLQRQGAPPARLAASALVAHRTRPSSTHPDSGSSRMNFDGILFFPVTPFATDGTIDHELLAQHVDRGVTAGAGGVFPACGTGEFHALSAGEAASVVRTAVSAVAGRAPVVAGPRGPLGHAIDVAQAASDGG